MYKIYSILILSLLCLLTQAQNSYKFPASTQIYDLDGGNFLSHYISNNKAYLQERDSTGAILWQDSIVGTSDNQLNLASIQLERFGTSNDYVVFLLDKIIDDSTVMHFAKLSFRDKSLSELKKVKLPLHILLSSRLSNESITLMSGKYNVFDREVAHDVFTLDNKLSLVKQSQNSFFSKPTIYSRFNLILNDSDGLTEIYSHYGDFYSKTYDKNFNELSIDSSALLDDYNYCDILYLQQHGNDSMFMFHYGYDVDGDRNKNFWLLSWSDKKLNILKSYQRVYDRAQGIYGLGYNSVVTNDNNVFVLATQVIRIVGKPDTYDQRVFVFDYDFNELCNFKIDIGYETINKVVLVNNEAYLSRIISNQLELIRINNCALATGIGNTDEVSPTSSIYPNPNNGKFVLKTAQNVQGNTATVYNILGKKLAEFKLNNEFDNALDIEQGAGVYFLRLNSNTSTIKLIVN